MPDLAFGYLIGLLAGIALDRIILEVWARRSRKARKPDFPQSLPPGFGKPWENAEFRKKRRGSAVYGG